MESKNNIDKLFKDKLGNREFVIKESFLADLDGKLAAQNPTKKYWGLIFFAALFIVGASLTYYFMSSRDVANSMSSQMVANYSSKYLEKESANNIETENTTITENREVSSVSADVSISGNDSNKGDDQTGSNNESDVLDATNLTSNNQNNTLKDENINVTSSSNSSKGTNTKSSVSSNTNESETNLTKENSNNKNEKSTNEQNELKSSTNESSIGGNENTVASNESNTTSSEKDEVSNDSNNVNENNNSEEIAINKNEIAGDMAIKTNETDGDSIKSEEIKNEELLTAVDTVLVNNGEEQVDIVVQDTVLNESELIEEILDTIADEKEVANNTETNSPKTTKTNRWTASVFGGPSLINKKLIDSLTEELVSIRRNEETSILSMSFGARINYSFNERVNLSLGVNSVTYGEEVNYTSLYHTSHTDTSYTNVILTPFQDSLGQWDTLVTTEIIDTTYFDTTGVSYSGSNRHSYIQIPIMLGYKFTFDKLSVNVRLGGSYGILLKSKGNYANVDLYVDPADMKKSVINLVASTVVSYKLKGFNIFIEPKYRFNTGSIINDSFVKQKYNALGCNFGLSFDF